MAMGEISFPDASTVHLKPHLLAVRQQQHPSYFVSVLLPLPRWVLWIAGVSLALYPLSVILLEKYRDAFQDDWQIRVQSSMDGTTGMLLGIGVQFLDMLSHWIVLVSPRIAAAAVLIHIACCLAYVALSILSTNTGHHLRKGKKNV
jgi:hypothetical protein